MTMLAGQRNAPDHIIAVVAALTHLPADMDAAAWYRQVRRVADYVWVEAWLAGALDHGLVRRD